MKTFAAHASVLNIAAANTAASFARRRDNLGRIIHRCEMVGCDYKTGCTGNLKKHMTAKHGIEFELKAKQKNDGMVRDKWGQIVRMCGVEGCEVRMCEERKMRLGARSEATKR